MAALREILAHFGVTFDDKPLKAGAGAVEGFIGKLKAFAGALGVGLSLGAIYKFTDGLIEEADALAKQSRLLGVSMAELQQWNYAASLAGVSSQALASTLSRLSSGRYDPKAMKELGVSVKDAAGGMRGATDILDDVADQLSKTTDPAERNRLAMRLLGRNYAQLMPLLEGGAEGLRKTREEFEAFGGGFTEDFGKSAEEYNDNLTRVKTLWKNLAITILSRVLPTLLELSKRAVTLVQVVVKVVRNTKLFEAAAIGLALRGIVLLAGKIGPLGKALKTLSGQFFKVILPLLILEDLLVFLAGGDSAFGRMLENVFGKGTAEKVRAWVLYVWAEFTRFIEDIRKRPEKLLDDWRVFTSELKKDIQAAFGKYIGGYIIAIGKTWAFVMDLMTGGWANFKDKVSASGEVLLGLLRVQWVAFKNGWLLVIASVQDAFTQLWNGIVAGTQAPLRLMSKVAGLTKRTGLQKDIDELIGGLESHKGAADAFERVDAAGKAELAQVREEMVAAGRVIKGAPSPVNINTEVNVTVPPGTPAEVANRVATAAANGASKGATINMKATHAALKPGGA